MNLIFAIFVLYSYFGKSFLISAAPLILSMVVNKYLGAIIKKLKKERKHCADLKSNEINETLINVKMLKLYGWQDEF